ncbi:MAG: LysR family transcriptional regulator [Mesorhizobium sp.]|uniref:LysR family transcriptional regulator n=1 Tax=Mesorhizobium sp. TaxID=1871066 RepID=UPI00120D9475|nr:LysR family transcriptional regulator [Mesorhizobium sp.]TIR03459.1 MAG: LysR family transcriptional regulator [Mesorhizobium sp.]
MKTLKTSLPLLNAMVAFEAAARNGGLTSAAEELKIAQSAVSRHVANLEQQLAVSLFMRKGNRVTLTETGRSLAEAIRDGLDTIRQAVERLQTPDRDTFVVGCTYDLQQMWLMPRFDLVASRIPNGQVMLLTSYDYRDFDQPDVALSLRFGRPEDWPGLVATKLFDGEWFPVCSPAFLAQYPALTSENPKALLGVPLLHSTTQPGAVDSWESWIGTERKLDGPRFTNYLSMMHETIAGRGAALAWVGFIEEHIRLGRVVRLTATSRRHQSSFYIVTRKKSSPAIRAVTMALVDSVEHHRP